MIELPLKKVKATRINPKKIIIFGKPKVGKTTALSNLENCLILDLEGGSSYVDAVKIDILEISRANNETPISVLKQIIDKLKSSNKENNGFVYKYGAIDTISMLEDMVMPIAVSLYKQTAMGRNFQSDNVLTLPNGAGYQYTRQALWLVLEELEQCFDTLIILGHLKDKLVEKEGKEMTERGLDLIGKSASILCSQVDAIGYMYRDENQTIVNFAPSESIICGSRSEHLKNKKVTLIESDDAGNITVDWSQIFLKE
jgi:Cdc6-like AAA superfamily ATPase